MFTILSWFCVFFSGFGSSPCTGNKNGWFWCKCSQTCIPPKEGDDPENPSWAVCNGKNDCCGTIHGVLAFEMKCADPANYTAKVQCTRIEISILENW